MNAISKICRPASQTRVQQRGVALIVALILLIVATMLGLSGIQGTTLQERMSGNLYDRSIAMQASEAALRAAEAALSADPDLGIDCRPTTAVACGPIPANTFTGTNADWTNVTGAFIANAGISAGTAQYHIQIMGEGSSEDELGLNSSANLNQYGSGGGTPTARFYRVTARSHVPGAGVDNRAFVVLSITVRRNI